MYVNSVHDEGNSTEFVYDDKKKKNNCYMCFDETFFKNLEKMGWNRDNGYIELMPIVVGMAS
jgi:hypothetical protein